MQQARLRTVTLPLYANYLNGSLGDLALHATGVVVVSVRRADGRVVTPKDEMLLAAGDALVLSGTPQPLALAEARLLAG